MSSAINEFGYPSSGQAPDLGVLSKSKFMAGVQCLKRLHLQTYAAESEIVADASQQGHIKEGRQVGELARTAFPGGVLVESGNFAAGNALAQTAAIIENASVPAIFEAAFRFQGVFIRVDILQRQPGNRWRLIEVKSSTSCKDHSLYDLAIQLYVLSGCGFDVTSACLMHLDRSYVYDGKSHDATKLFTIVDFTAEVRAIEKEVTGLVAAQRNVLLNPIPPTTPPGGHCGDPYECEFFSTCNLPLPANHISMLPNLSAKKAAMLAAANISLVPAIPLDFPMSELQQRVCECVKSGQPWFSDSLAGDLSELQYPLHFMDFETLFPAIPRHAGMGPYSHIPFQWSVHRQPTPGAAVEHFEFLAEDGNDPRRSFFNGLSRVVGDTGNIVAYNASFEIQRLDWHDLRAVGLK